MLRTGATTTSDDRYGENCDMRTILLTSVLALPMAAFAETGSNLDMSVSGTQLLKEELGQGQGSDLGTECQALLEQIDALKGAPLRRSALLERYQEQCQGRMNAAPSYAPPLPQ
jgi:hypothetical protein